MVPVSDEEVIHKDETAMSKRAQKFEEKIERGGMKYKLRSSSIVQRQHFYSICILLLSFGLASASGDNAMIDPVFAVKVVTAAATAAAVGVDMIGVLISRANTTNGAGPIKYIMAPAGSLGVSGIVLKSEIVPGIEITKIKPNCILKHEVEVGDLIVTNNGNAVESLEDLRRERDNEKNLSVIK